MQNTGLDDQAGIKTAKRNINHLRYADDTALMAEYEEELKSLLIRVKEGSEKADLIYYIQKTKVITSGPITLWQIDGEKVETVSDLAFLGSKIIEDGDCSHQIERYLFLGKKDMTKLDNTLKSSDYHFAEKGPYSQSYGFSSSHIWMWELYNKGWALKNWCFQIVVLEKTLGSLMDCKEIKPVSSKGNQSWIFIRRTDAEAETPINLAIW